MALPKFPSVFLDVEQFYRYVLSYEAVNLTVMGLRDVPRFVHIAGALAERMVLELRDKAGVLLAGLATPGVSEPVHPEGKGGRVHEVALAALVELGYSAKDARSRVEAAWKLLREQMGSDSPGEAIQAEDVIREALKNS